MAMQPAMLWRPQRRHRTQARANFALTNCRPKSEGKKPKPAEKETPPPARGGCETPKGKPPSPKPGMAP